jgi:hypothetical protein
MSDKIIDLKEKSEFERPIAALMLNPLDKDARERLISLWRRHGLMPDSLRIYHLYSLEFGTDIPALLDSFTSEKEARDDFVDMVKDRYEEFFYENHVQNYGMTMEEAIENNKMRDIRGNHFDIDSSDFWVDGTSTLWIETIDVEIE